MSEKYILAAMLAAIGSITSLTAQTTYTKDVDVTVELNPEVRAASRLDLSPTLLTKSFPASTLHYSGAPVSVGVTPMITPLTILSPEAIYSRPDSRGYLTAGYFPGTDFGVSAGYALIDRRATRLNLWTQLNRNTYHSPLDLDGGDKVRVAATDWVIGGDFAHVAGAGTLNLATSLYLSHFNYPGAMMSPSSQDVTRYRLEGGWHSPAKRSGGFSYGIDGGMDLFSYGKSSLPTGFENEGTSGNSLGEVSGTVTARARYMINSGIGFGLKVGYQGASVSGRHLHMPGENIFRDAPDSHCGIVTAGASFIFDSGHFSGHIGPVVDIYTGDASGTHTGAEGVVNWAPSEYFSLYATATSGSRLNTLGRLYEVNRYAAPLAGANPSFLDADITVGMKLGSWKGFSMTVTGGMCSASSWAMPVLAEGVGTFAMTDLSSLYYGVRLDYVNGRRFDASASFEGALSDEPTHAYYKWADRAKNVANVTVNWHPVDRLTLSAAYDLRLGRRICRLDYIFVNLDAGTDVPPTSYQQLMDISLEGLGRVSGFTVSADYNINDRWGVFARVSGIGQGRYLTAGAMPGRRLGGLFGITLKL